MFTDVSPDDWAAQSIERQAKKGMMVGDPDGSFRPDSPVTRREMASILDRQDAYNDNFKDIIKTVSQAVFALVYGGNEGTGFFVDAAGHIVTNKHVASVAATGSLTILKDGWPSMSAKVIAVSADHDLALLKVDGFTPPAFFKFSTADVQQGDHVGIIGAPLGYTDTFTQGQVSSTHRQDLSGNIVDSFQTDAAVNPGNSGGPIFNVSGDVVGIVWGKFMGADNIAFGIHARYMREFLAQNGVPV